MLTKAEIKLITQLKQKKFRNHHNLFIVEGFKSISEFIHSPFSLKTLYSTEETLFHSLPKSKTKLISLQELQKISLLKKPQQALALFEIPKWNLGEIQDFHIALDSIQDPGNLGTIIRLSDWFGVKHIVCSRETADAFNPKVIQASMGSLSRIKIYYTDLKNYLKQYDKPILGAFMNGKNLYNQSLSPEGILVLGNEGNGISPDIEALCTQKISIPQNTKNGITESLNVAIAGSIIISKIFTETLK